MFCETNCFWATLRWWPPKQAAMDCVFETMPKTGTAMAETLLALFQRHSTLVGMLAGPGGKGTPAANGGSDGLFG